MKITVLRSESQKVNKDQYELRMNTLYSKRFLGHIRDKGSYCSSCGEACISCRKHYDLDFSDSIAEIISFPAVLPVMIDDAQEYLPGSVKEHDILIAISIHEELLQPSQTFCHSKHHLK